MAIISKGYERTLNYADFSRVMSHAGAEYSVFGADSFKASIGGADRQIILSDGRAAGQGILDDSDAPISLVGAPVSAGNRWDLVALRRTWSSVVGESSTTAVLIPGTAAKAIPTRSVGEGEEDDQPLWLARFAAGQTAVQELVDVRCWHGAGGVAAKDLLVRDYLTRIGTRVWIAGITWVYGFNSAGTPAWVPDSVYVGSTAPAYVEGLGWIKVP